MTTILLVILGVLLAAAAVLFVVYYGGDAFGNGHIEAEAGRLVGEGAQMEAALELFYRQEGHYPTSDDPVAELIAAGYLTHQPLGTRTTDADRWAINYDAGMIMARLGGVDHEETTSICLKARQQLDLPAANTSTGIYRCDGTDSPGGRLAGREPCCIGEVGVGGGPAESDIFARATLCNNLTSMPVNTDAEKAAYVRAMGACVNQRSTLTDRYITSLSDIGSPTFNDSAVGGSNPTFIDYSNGHFYFRYDVANSSQCASIGQKGSFDWAVDDFCIADRNQPIRYYRKMTDAYRPVQLEKIRSEFAKIYQSASSRMTFDNASYSSANGYQPSFEGNATGFTFQEYGNGNLFIRATVPGGLCQYWKSSTGDGSNNANEPEFCEIYGPYLQVNYTDQIRDTQITKLRSEAAKMRDSALANNAFTSDFYRSSGSYAPDLKGIGSDYGIVEYGRNVYLYINTNGSLCTWWKNTTGDGRFDNNEAEYCEIYYDKPFRFNVTTPFRESTHSRLQAELGRKIANDTYVPQLQGIASSIQVVTYGNGNKFLRANLEPMPGFCDWWKAKTGDGSNNANEPEFCEIYGDYFQMKY